MTRRPKRDGGKSSGSKTGAAKNPATKSPATKTDTAKAGATEAGGARNGGHKAAGPENNGHAKAQADKPQAAKAPAAQPGGPAAKAPRKANRRGAARLAAVQALYQMDMTGAGLNEILAQFESHWLGREVEGEQYLPAEAAFFRDIVSGVVNVQRDLDPRIDAALEATWPLKRIQAILRSVLRAGAYELEKRTDIPARVVVSEYVDVAHAFVDKSETGMVNAVLDRLARNVRAGEFG
jgi:N utilization substance protein B